MKNNLLLTVFIIFVFTSCIERKEANKPETHKDRATLEFPDKIIKGNSIKIELKYQLHFDSLNLKIDGLDLKPKEMRKKLFYYKDGYISENDLFKIAKDSSKKAQKKMGIKKIKLKNKNSTVFYYKFHNTGKTQFCGLLVDMVITPDKENDDSVQMKYSTIYLRRNIDVKNKDPQEQISK